MSWEISTLNDFIKTMHSTQNNLENAGQLYQNLRIKWLPQHELYGLLQPRKSNMKSQQNTSQYSRHRFIQSFRIKAHIQSECSDWLWGTISPKVSLTNRVRRKYPFALLPILIKNVPQNFLHIKTAIQSVSIRPPEMHLEENEFSTELRWKLFSEISHVLHCARP